MVALASTHPDRVGWIRLPKPSLLIMQFATIKNTEREVILHHLGWIAKARGTDPKISSTFKHYFERSHVP
jgi:hypothetical protein